MRFYTQRRTFYCGVDLHARWMYLCILSHEGAVIFQRNLATGPEPFLESILAHRIGLAVFHMLKRGKAFDVNKFVQA